MKQLFLMILVILLTLNFNPVATAKALPAHITQALQDGARTAEHRRMDTYRKPGEILTLAGVEKGHKVAELAVGGGYYAALLSRVVGDSGHVYAVDPSVIFEYFPNARDTFAQFREKDPLPNVSYSVQRMDELELPSPVDVIFMVLYYHDVYWTGEDREAMNKAIYDHLKTGGRFVVIDHMASAQASETDAKALHRMPPNLILPEVRAAGFVLEIQSDVLRNPEDPLDVSVFDSAWRGRTDRVVYVFQKP